MHMINSEKSKDTIAATVSPVVTATPISTTSPETELSNFDRLKALFCEDYQITDQILVSQPTIGDIMELGEKEVYSVINMFVANTTMYRLFLWDNGIDWNKISDFELFTLLAPGIDYNYSRLIIKDIDFSKFKRYSMKHADSEGKETEQLVLYSQELDLVITEDIYLKIRKYLRTLFNIHPKNEFAKGRTTKEWMIEEERMEHEKMKGETADSSILYPLISTCINHPGFKYKLQELKEVGIYQFMDSVSRLQIYEQSSALLKGMYSGFIDTKSIRSEDYNFFRESSASEADKKKPASEKQSEVVEKVKNEKIKDKIASLKKR